MSIHINHQFSHFPSSLCFYLYIIPSSPFLHFQLILHCSTFRFTNSTTSSLSLLPHSFIYHLIFNCLLSILVTINLFHLLSSLALPTPLLSTQLPLPHFTFSKRSLPFLSLSFSVPLTFNPGIMGNLMLLFLSCRLKLRYSLLSVRAACP